MKVRGWRVQQDARFDMENRHKDAHALATKYIIWDNNNGRKDRMLDNQCIRHCKQSINGLYGIIKWDHFLTRWHNIRFKAGSTCGKVFFKYFNHLICHYWIAIAWCTLDAGISACTQYMMFYDHCVQFRLFELWNAMYCAAENDKSTFKPSTVIPLFSLQ